MKRKLFKIVTLQPTFLFLFLLMISRTVSGQGLPAGTPKKLCLSSERLNRIDSVMNDYVKNGKMPGMVTMIIRHGKVGYFKSFGMKDMEEKKEMSNDAIFRIVSMSKAITTVAVMTLYEEGYFLLTDPISKYIPEFKNPKVVMRSATSDSIIFVPAKSEITIRELLNHTSGITYGDALQGRYYRQAYQGHQLFSIPGTSDLFFGWDGAFYTRFWIDPKEDLIGIFLSQVDNYWSENLIGKFKNLVYQSISE